MIADRKDVLGPMVQKRHQEANQRMLPMAQVLLGAAPVMDKLARTEEWGRYCTMLQGVLEKFAARKQTALLKLADPSVTKDEDVRKLRQDIFTADVTIDTLKFAIELPAAILAGGKEADEFVKNVEKKSGDTDSQAP